VDGVCGWCLWMVLGSLARYRTFHISKPQHKNIQLPPISSTFLRSQSIIQRKHPFLQSFISTCPTSRKHTLRRFYTHVCEEQVQRSTNTRAMQDPATASWDLPISSADFAKLKAGFEPQDQDDKWRFSSSTFSSSQTASDNNISIHVIRTGTREEHYVFHLIIPPSNSSSGDGAKISALTWSQNMGGIRMPEHLAKKEVVLIARSVLEAEFEALPDYSFDETFNHPARRIENSIPTTD
jgi:hypothetical protein